MNFGHDDDENLIAMMMTRLMLGILVCQTSTTHRGHSSHIKPQLHITPVLHKKKKKKVIKKHSKP